MSGPVKPQFSRQRKQITTDATSLKTIVLCFNAFTAIFVIAIPRMGEMIALKIEILFHFGCIAKTGEWQVLWKNFMWQSNTLIAVSACGNSCTNSTSDLKCGKSFLISFRLNADYALGMPSGSQPRPLGIVVLSALQLFVAIYMLVISYQMAHGQVLGGASREVLGALASRAPYLALLAVLPAALSIGLYLMANWARVFALVLYCLSLLGCIFSWANLLIYAHSVEIPTIVFNVLLLRTAVYGWAVIYLLRPRVVHAFREAY
jgi:hypothetical protein